MMAKRIVIDGIDGQDESDFIFVHRMLRKYREEVAAYGPHEADKRFYGRHNLVAVRETIEEITVRFLREPTGVQQ